MLVLTKFNENKKLNGNQKRLKQNQSETHHTIPGGGRMREIITILTLPRAVQCLLLGRQL